MIYSESMKSLLKHFLLILLISFSAILPGCDKEKEIIEPQNPSVTDMFESGSIGQTNKISDTDWELYIADDNDNPNVPDSWRSWWYVRMDNLKTNEATNITIKNSGWEYYYLPVYSYNQKEWNRFSENEISQNSNKEIVITKQFEQARVWIAMFYPYTLTDLEDYLSTLTGNPNVNISVAGQSQNNNPIYLIKVSDFSVPAGEKKSILIHARTHPAETPPSFLIEGLINFLTGGSEEADDMLRNFEFHIFPMQNVDGVIAGNYRSTPKSENLEVMWYYNSLDPQQLSIDTPPEIKIIHEYALQLMTMGQQVSIALNLHASNSEPDIRPFFFPHFGPESFGYSSQEAALWEKQLHFISTVAYHYGYAMVEPVPAQGGRSFAAKQYPESWWWVNYKDQVMAMTMEMTYGRAGYAPEWVTPDNIRDLGESVALGIRDYFRLPVQSPYIVNYKSIPLRYPDLYPPYAEDELKE